MAAPSCGKRASTFFFLFACPPSWLMNRNGHRTRENGPFTAICESRQALFCNLSVVRRKTRCFLFCFLLRVVCGNGHAGCKLYSLTHSSQGNEQNQKLNWDPHHKLNWDPQQGASSRNHKKITLGFHSFGCRFVFLIVTYSRSTTAYKYPSPERPWDNSVFFAFHTNFETFSSSDGWAGWDAWNSASRRFFFFKIQVWKFVFGGSWTFCFTQVFFRTPVFLGMPHTTCPTSPCWPWYLHCSWKGSRRPISLMRTHNP